MSFDNDVEPNLFEPEVREPRPVENNPSAISEKDSTVSAQSNEDLRPVEPAQDPVTTNTDGVVSSQAEDNSVKREPTIIEEIKEISENKVSTLDLDPVVEEHHPFTSPPEIADENGTTESTIKKENEPADVQLNVSKIDLGYEPGSGRGPSNPTNKVDDSSTSFARFGACWSGSLGDEVSCSRSPTECDELPFWSRHDLYRINAISELKSNHRGPKSEDVSVSLNCSAQNVTAQRSSAWDACNVGGCDNGNNKAESNCSLVQDTETRVSTLYGACQGKCTSKIANCVWSADDCDDDIGESYLTPEEVVGVLAVNGSLAPNDKSHCDCSDVSIGACLTLRTNKLVCATSADQCSGTDQVFITPKEMRENPDDYDLTCQLCPKDAVDVATTLEFLDSMIPSFDMEPIVDTPNTIDSGNSDGSVIVAVSIAGGIFGLVVLACCGLMVARKRSNKKSRIVDVSAEATKIIRPKRTSNRSRNRRLVDSSC